ncbi:golgin-45-like isoform X1 [Macrobrachium nipponense]|uniref:golgin-45-like isoform X1 n=1 Tax=Macrobrachium nipponense TaxID=159736 RepID=UPI0030C85969
MKPSGAIRYPVEGLTLHRVAVGQRSQGDGEEQAAPSTPSLQETTSTHVRELCASEKTTPEISSPSEKCENVSLNENAIVSKTRLSSDKSAGEKPQKDKTLPSIQDIAQKLTKVSIMSSPDCHLLNTPPKDVNAKISYRLHPQLLTKSSAPIHKDGSPNFHNQKRKEPRFIPYEPYKGCVKPIDCKKTKSKAKVGGLPETTKHQNKTSPELVECDKKKAEMMSIVVQEFENERMTWEEEKASLHAEKQLLEDQLNQFKKDKANLESQLNVQSQVNTELKKLLVASVGEDVQGRVQCLTEDKARMASMIRRYSEKVDKDYEEKERMGIQCDVWRSKFLGSSMLVDELASWKAVLSQRLEEAQEAVRILMDEHDLARQHILNTYRMNKQLREAFDPLAVTSGGIPPLTSADLVTLAVEGSLLSQTVRDHLCGPLGRSLGCSLSLEGLEIQTPGEKMARQISSVVIREPALVGQIQSKDNLRKLECGTVSPGAAAMLQRFHPNARYEHVTVNCCGHCNGEIKVI